MKMTWTNASIEELTINETLGGGKDKTEHDGVWNQDANGEWWEATQPLNSGKKAQ